MPTRNDFLATADFAMIHPEACGSLALLTDPILRAQRAAVPTRLTHRDASRAPRPWQRLVSRAFRLPGLALLQVEPIPPYHYAAIFEKV
jgi:hypothetical protein